MEHTLTYAWLVPILLAIIGTMIGAYLHALSATINNIRREITEHAEKVENMLNTLSEKYHMAEIRIAIIEREMSKSNER